MPLRSPHTAHFRQPTTVWNIAYQTVACLLQRSTEGTLSSPAFLYPFPLSLFRFFFRDGVGVGGVSAL